MKHNPLDQDFLQAIAPTETGSSLIRVLKNVENYYADIRNLQGVDAKVRVDALALLKEALLDKLLILSGKNEAPDNDEFH